jgi:hypothetical protein
MTSIILQNMKFTLLTILISISLTSYSQERKTKKIRTDSYIEIFTVDKNTNEKDGEYIKINKSTKDTLIYGNYKNDNKVGIWKYYSKNNRLFIAFDYEKKVLNQLPHKVAVVDSFPIRKDTSFYLSKVDSPPIYLGYENELHDILKQNALVPAEVCEKGISGTSLASFIVNCRGKIADIEIENSLSPELDKNIINTINKINGDWIPSKANGEIVDSKIYVLYNISPMVTTTTYFEKPYLLVVNLIYIGIIKAQQF